MDLDGGEAVQAVPERAFWPGRTGLIGGTSGRRRFPAAVGVERGDRRVDSERLTARINSRGAGQLHFGDPARSVSNSSLADAALPISPDRSILTV
jgi:hypothetical protein